MISGADLDEYKTALAPITSDWIKEMTGKKLAAEKVLARTKEVIAKHN